MHRGWFDVALEGVQMLREAHARAPDDNRIAGTYALAVARVLTGGADYESVSKGARDLAERTLERDPQQSEARIALGFIHLNDAEGAAAAVQLKKAIALSPNSVEALDAIGRMLVEISRPALGIATLHRALAIDPSMAQARQAIVRTHALLGEYDVANELLGDIPDQASDFLPYILMMARMALWRGETSLAQHLDSALARAKLSARAAQSIGGLLHVVKARSLTPEVREAMEAALPIDKRFSPRRSAFHAQIRAEVKLGAGEVAGAMTDLRQADSNGLLDLLWLDRCPLFDDVRSLPEFVTIRESTAARIERVARVLDP
jgi:serine/threonine-protein kinase